MRYKNLLAWGVGVILTLGVIFSNLTHSKAAGFDSNDFFALNDWARKDVKRNHLDKIYPQLRSSKRKIQKNALGECKYIFDRIYNHPHAFILCALAEKVLNKKGWLISRYQKALIVYPQHAITHAQYGWYLAMSLNKPKAGVKSLEKALVVDPKFKPAYSWLQKIYISMGQKKHAENIRERAKKHGVSLQTAK